MKKKTILTNREIYVINKKLNNKRLNQQDSNYLSKYVRPKLREIASINAEALLKRLEYNQKSRSIERKIRKLILDNLKDIYAIVLYGSAIQTNYKNYNDIDVLVITKRKSWGKSREKYGIINLLKENAQKIGLNLDIQIIDKSSFYIQYPNNASLIYQLKDSRMIYGKIKLPKEIELSKIYLRMKLDWSDMVDENSEGEEIYHAIRNAVLVKLLLNRIVDNNLLYKELVKEIGNNLLARLKYNKASKIEKRIAINYLQDLAESTRKEIINSKWEKMKLSNL